MSNYEFGGCAFKLELTPKNKAMEEHFVGGVSWDKTGIIEEVLYLRSVKARDNRLTVPTRSEVIRRYEELDKVYEDIRLNGYDEKKGSPINVAIGSDNEVYFCGNGWHRLWICQHLNVSSIPCRIIARHVNSDLNPPGIKRTSSIRYFFGRVLSRLRKHTKNLSELK